MPIQWQMIAPTGKREAVRIAKKVVDVYIDFGCFLSTRTDEARVVEECIKTEDARGLRLVAALHQGDDKAQSRKTLERVIKLLGLNKPSKKAIARQQEIMEGWRQLAEDLKSGVAFKNVLVPRN
ncbi:MAG: hypothetical protein RM021_008515 [Nostoc sp. EkiNYC01]|nr:hypothetical protein [Nostoc sp. EkiNYC01]